ncbi:MAG: dephospho-CoA kinase [Parvularcula sp.]|nr:dephospho-CoA kinase [Parvularcula sp.]
MIVLGLTGSIGMGKTTTAKLFADEGVPIWDADAAVHRLYAPGGAAVAPVLSLFPDVGSAEGGIDRARLSSVLGDPSALKALEEAVHPLVRRDQDAFLEHQREAGSEIVLLDIPLLAESGAAPLFDAVIVVTADEEVRRERVLARPGMTSEKLAGILARQAPERERLKIADFILRTDQGIEAARGEVRRILAQVREKHALSKPSANGSNES